jgi:hypothetical protein
MEAYMSNLIVNQDNKLIVGLNPNSFLVTGSAALMPFLPVPETDAGIGNFNAAGSYFRTNGNIATFSIDAANNACYLCKTTLLGGEGLDTSKLFKYDTYTGQKILEANCANGKIATEILIRPSDSSHIYVFAHNSFANGNGLVIQRYLKSTLGFVDSVVVGNQMNDVYFLAGNDLYAYGTNNGSLQFRVNLLTGDTISDSGRTCQLLQYESDVITYLDPSETSAWYAGTYHMIKMALPSWTYGNVLFEVDSGYGFLIATGVAGSRCETVIIDGHLYIPVRNASHSGKIVKYNATTGSKVSQITSPRIEVTFQDPDVIRKNSDGSLLYILDRNQNSIFTVAPF